MELLKSPTVFSSNLLRKKLDILKKMQLVSQLERKEEFSQIPTDLIVFLLNRNIYLNKR